MYIRTLRGQVSRYIYNEYFLLRIHCGIEILDRAYFAEIRLHTLNSEISEEYTILFIYNKLRMPSCAVYTYSQLPLGPLHNLRRNMSCVKLLYL